jgi:hypothetical protein
VIGDAQGYQFLIATHQMGYAAQGDGDPTGQQGLMHFRHTAVLAEAPLANQRNDIQAKLAMRQRPAPFFFRTLAFMGGGAVRLDALADDERQSPLASSRGHAAMAVIGHRQGLAALLTGLFQRDEDFLVRRFGARSSASHALSPPGFLTRFLLLDYTSLQPQFATQLFPGRAKFDQLHSKDIMRRRRATQYETEGDMAVFNLSPGVSDEIYMYGGSFHFIPP